MVMAIVTTARAQPASSPQASSKTSALIQQLQDPDPVRRKEAATALMVMKPVPPEAENAMLSAVAFPYPEVRKAIADGGGLPIADLTAEVRGTDANARVGALWVLGDMGKHNSAVWPILLEALSSDDGAVRGVAANQFSNASDADARMLVPKLRERLKDKRPEIRLAGVEALSGLGPRAKDATPDIAAMLHDSPRDNRSMAIEALRSIGPPAASAAGELANVLKDPDPELREDAAFALLTIDPHNRAAIPIMIEVLNRPDGMNSGGATAALETMGPEANEALPDLAHLLTVGRNPNETPDESTPADTTRFYIAKMIGKVGGKNSVPALSEALMHDPVDEVRKAALASIENLGADETAIPALIEAMRDRDDMIRYDAKNTLAKLGNAAVPALIAALKNKDFYIRDGAVDTLSGINRLHPLPDDAVRALVDTAAHDKSNIVREDAEIALQDVPGPMAEAGLTNLAPLPESTPEPNDTGKIYTKAEIVATFPADDDHEYPLELTSLLPIDDGRFLVSFHQGKDRGDRVAIWKKLGTDKYEQLQVIEANTDVDQTISPPSLFTPAGQPDGEKNQFLDIVSGTRCCTDEDLFVIDRKANDLLPVEIDSADKKFQTLLRPGEEFSSHDVNFFDDGKFPHFELALAKKGDPDCCPSAGLIVGTYKIIKETGSESTAKPSWKFVPVDGARKPMPPP